MTAKWKDLYVKYVLNLPIVQISHNPPLMLKYIWFYSLWCCWKSTLKASFLSKNSFFFFFFLCLFYLFFFFCSEFCHTLKWNVLEFTCLPHPDPPPHLPQDVAYYSQTLDLKQIQIDSTFKSVLEYLFHMITFC